MTEDPDLAALSDAGFHEMTREITLRSGGEVLEQDGLLMVASSSIPRRTSSMQTR